MNEEINPITYAVQRAIDNFSIPVLTRKTVLHYYLTKRKVIAVTDIIPFYEVGYCYDSTNVVDRCVIEEEYLEKHPLEYRKFYTWQEVEATLIERKAA